MDTGSFVSGVNHLENIFKDVISKRLSEICKSDDFKKFVENELEALVASTTLSIAKRISTQTMENKLIIEINTKDLQL